jgi:hypothetical protein
MKAGRLSERKMKVIKQSAAVFGRTGFSLRGVISVLLPATDIFLYACSHTQLTIRDNIYIYCMFQFDKAIIKPLNKILKRKN